MGGEVTRSPRKANDPLMLHLKLPQAGLSFNCKHCGHCAIFLLLVVQKMKAVGKGY